MNTRTATHAMFDVPAPHLDAACRGAPGLLASRWFWVGGIASCGAWGLAGWAIAHCF